MKSLKSKLALLLTVSVLVLTACGSGASTQEISDLKSVIEQTEPENNSMNYMHLGEMYYRNQDYTNALEAYQSALEHSDDKGQVYSNISTLQKELGENDDALESIELAIQEDPTNALYYTKKAKLLRYEFEQSAFDMGEFYRTAISMTKNDTGFISIAASHYEYEGKNGDIAGYEQALSFYRIILSKKPDDENVLTKIEVLEDLIDNFENQ